MNLNFWPESQICVGCKSGELQLNTDEPCVYKCKYKPEGGKCKYHEDGVAVKYLGGSGINIPYGDIYPEQLAEQTNDLVKLCTGLAKVAMQNAVDTEGKSVWWEE
jgi:hypothetical protein